MTTHNEIVRELHDCNYAEELELSPAQATYEDWRFAEERRARLAWRQRRLGFRLWLRRNRGGIRFVGFLVAFMFGEIGALLLAAHWLGLKVW